MKYIIDLPEEFAEATKEYWDKTVGMQLEPYIESNREVIENEVWDLANYMGRMSLTERDLCFGFPLPQEVTMNLSYQEAKAKFEAWLKEKNEIKVGDEVIDKDGHKAIATYVYTDCKLCDVLWDDGSVTEDVYKEEFSKTGRHFPEVVELLEKMKEN